MKREVNEELQIKFIVAFLNSTFGQIQFEIHSNNQEGLRKIEGFMIKKLKVPDLSIFNETEIKEVVEEFAKLDNLNKDFSGTEKESERLNLDYSIGKLIFNKNNLGFKNYKDLTRFFVEFCRDITIDRGNNHE